jgi:hypothetical protein
MSLAMLLAGSSKIGRYFDFYCQYAADKWENLTPMQYGSLLISVGVFGWILMKSGRR